MKFLIDANLSPALCRTLALDYPDSRHVFEFGIERSDEDVFKLAHSEGYMVLTKDDDFDSLALLAGPPAKAEIDRVSEFANSMDASLLILP